MGIVLVYRSTRVINFAVGNMGIPADRAVRGDGRQARLAVLAVARPARSLVGTLTGVLVELAVIRRLFKSPRVIVLVATIGVAQLCEAVTLALARLPHRLAADAIPGAVQRQVAPGPRHRGVRQPAARADRRPAHHRRAVVAARAHRVRRRGAGGGVQLRPRPHDRHQPEDGVDRGLGDRRLPRHGRGPAHRHRPGLGRPRAHRARHAAARHGRGADRRHGVVPARRARARSSSASSTGCSFFNYTTETGLVQFVLFLVVLVLVARVSRNDAAPAGESFQFAPRIAAVPERLREHLVGQADAAARRGLRAAGRGRRCRCCPTSRSATRPGRRSSPSRCARSRWSCSPAGAVSCRSGRWRSPASARSPPPRSSAACQFEHRLARHPHPRRRAARDLVPVGAAPRRGRSRAWSRCSSASARCASAGCCSRSARSRSRSPRRCTSSTGRSSPPAARRSRSRAPTSGRSSSPTGTARTTTSCCSCSSSCCCSSATSSAPASAA